MKFKSIYLSAALALFLASCSSTKKITAEPISVTNITPKQAELTDREEERWSHLDILMDTIPGMSVDRAYKLLEGRKAEKVIVGVIDSGVDIEHPDLQGQIWTNEDEVAGNGKDDDNNGFIDDVHGWNFLGDINHENMEFVRILKKGDDGSELYKKAKEEYDAEYGEAMSGKQRMEFFLKADKAIQDALGKEDYTVEDLESLETEDAMVNSVKDVFKRILSQVERDEFISQVQSGVDHFNSKLNYHLNLKYNPRADILGDDEDDFNARGYGNGNVIGPDKDGAKHGTHVAGIIAQLRGNGIGGDGVASEVVEIMPVRAVPDGDEYDKDVALAIRYAVDNGAKVINGSFGKYYATHSDWVYDAIKYAAEKDVLIVCAAGNEGTDLNQPGGVERYPNDNMNGGPEISNNFLSVGALAYNLDEGLIASFSNYGKKDVDVFSPGVRIYATTPDNNYEFLQGTSMASPNAAGVAALIRAYFPKLSAAEVKQVIMQSGLSIDMEVAAGGDANDMRAFSDVSITGKVVNAYNAIILADKMSRMK
ncbi:peptidase S8 [Flavobacterium suaedae]|uniref:Peptidase S8 n=1 Tax=Flavobacterium suaedae TaxID=1767027 RepID=A0ABQ1JUT6_9FLAO|nr:S8 family peptidase [Flavobacterium suaedae]GGB77130.1 peptidase S8 [Flavobacterium suaedae]